MSRTVVIHADHLDPVALRAMATGVPAMHIDELIPVMERQPWPEVLRLSPGAHLEHLFRGANVVNRVFSLAGTQIEQFLAERGVDARWFHIRLQPLLALGVSLCHDTGTRGVSRCLAPLNVQWFELERALPDANTPDFAYSFGYEEPDLSRIEDPMQKSVWSLFDWRQERQLDDEERRRHQFHVSRPKGVPVVAWFLGRDYNGIHFPRESVEVDGGVCEQLTRAAAHAFRSEAGEMLLYVTEEAVTFHAFSPYLRSVAADAAVQDALDAWLLTGGAGGVNAA